MNLFLFHFQYFERVPLAIFSLQSYMGSVSGRPFITTSWTSDNFLDNHYLAVAWKHATVLLSHYPDSKKDIYILFPVELWMGSWVKIVTRKLLSICLKPTYTAVSRRAPSPSPAAFWVFWSFWLVGLSISLCCVLFCYHSYFSLSMSIPCASMQQYVTQVSALNVRDSFGCLNGRASDRCCQSMCDILTFLWLPTSFSEDKYIWTYIQNSDI